MEKLIIYPDKRLKQICEPVTNFDELAPTFMYMSKHLCDMNAYAMAAPQVGIPMRFFVLSGVGNDEELADKPKVICNPRIVDPEGSSKFKEGCLSFPGIFAWIERYEKFTLQYQDAAGTEKECIADGLFATICQHEIDHLDGVLFIDKMSQWEKNKVIKKINKLRKKAK